MLQVVKRQPAVITAKDPLPLPGSVFTQIFWFRNRGFFYLTKDFSKEVNVTSLWRKNFADYFNVGEMFFINTAKAGGTGLSLGQCAGVRMRLLWLRISVGSVTTVIFAVFSRSQAGGCSLKYKRKQTLRCKTKTPSSDVIDIGRTDSTA